MATQSPYLRENITVKASFNSGSDDYVKQKKTPQFWANTIEELAHNSVAWGRMIEGGAKANGAALTAAAELMAPWMRGTPFEQGLRMWGGSLSKAADSLERANDAQEEAAKSIGNRQFKSSVFHSNDWGDWMIQRGIGMDGDTGVNEELNFGFFTHNRYKDKERNGSLNEINPDAIIEAFSPKKNRKDWPNLLLNCNHALVQDHLDISGIMKGFHALASYCFADPKTGKSRDLKLIMRHDDRENGNGHDRNGKDTIMLAAVFNDWNAWVNGGKLIKRINHLDALHVREEEAPLKREEREREYIGQGDVAMSPTSVMLAKLLLKLIVEEPEKIHIPTRADFESYGPYRDGKIYDGDLTCALLDSDESIKIRNDAGKILQHVLPEGYSKGGNIVTDAVRFLLLDLQRPLAKSADEKRLFYCGDDPNKPITNEQIHDLIFNMGILRANPGTTPLNRYEKANGMRAVSVGSGGDLIIGHLLERPLMSDLLSRDKDGRDDFYIVHPSETASQLGHGYLDALGTRDIGGYKEGSGYIIDPNKQKISNGTADEARKNAHEVRSRMRVIHAACYDAVGVSNIKYQHDGDQHRYRLEFSRGASSEQITLIEQRIAMKLQEKRVGTIQCDLEGPGACYISIRGMDTKQANQEMAKALEGVAFSKPKTGQPELFVGDHVYYRLGAEPLHLREEQGRAA